MNFAQTNILLLYKVLVTRHRTKYLQISNRIRYFTILALLTSITFQVSSQNISIVSISPQANSNNVPLNSNIVITFDQVINATTLTSSSIVVRGSQTGVVSGVLTGGGSSTITFDPTKNFRLGEVVLITINKSLKSISNFSLARGHTYSFTAISGVPPSTPATFAQRHVSFNTLSDDEDAAAIDFEGDGDLDFVISGFVGLGTGYSYLWENNGTQGFCNRKVGENRNVELFDIDGDGDLDSFAPGGNNVNLYWHRNENNGGPFTSVFIASTTIAWTVTGGDIDSDGDIDAVAAMANGTGTSTLRWLGNNGTGSFSAGLAIASFAGGSLSRFHVVDVDSDGAMDVVGYDQNALKLVWYRNDGSQNFTEKPIGTFTSNTDYHRIAWADIDADGDLDIFSAAASSTPRLNWYENDGNENFTRRSITVAAGNRLNYVRVTDVDGDLDMDLVAGAFWFENDGSENFTQKLISPGLIPTGSTAFAATGNYVDMDNDGDMDLITVGRDGYSWAENVKFLDITSTTPANGKFDVAANANISITFNQPIKLSSVSSNSINVVSNWRGPVSGSFSGSSGNTIIFDPTKDFLPGEAINISINEKIVSITNERLEGNHSFSFKAKAPTATASSTFTYNSIKIHGTQAIGMDIADLDGDGDLDAITCSTTELFWHQNAGGGNFTTIPIPTSNLPNMVLAVDYNKDGKMDIVTRGISSTLIYVLLNNGSQVFTESTVPTVSASFISDLADINGDGDTDAVNLARWQDINCAVYSNAPWPTLSGTARAIRAVDLDNDGDMDFIRTATTGTSVLLNDGYLNYSSLSLEATSSTNIDFADVDGDGDIDPIIVLTNLSIAWYPNNLNTASNNFGTRKTIGSLSADPRSVTATDLDGDGDADIAAISRTDDKIVWYKNRLNEATVDFSSAQLLPLTADGPLSIKSGDFNGDGRMDLVVLSDNDNELAWFANVPAALLPTITNFTPGSGPVGTTVVINGTNFSTTPSNNTVTFYDGVNSNVVTAVVTASTATSITCTVPPGAFTGPIKVATAGGDALSSSNFTITCGPVPTITSFSPGSGVVGTTVVITGTNFSTVPSDNIVDFGGYTSIVSASTVTSITTTVPTGPNGLVPISISIACNTITSSTNFDVICPPAPTITSFTPSTGVVGTTVTITGTNFSSNPVDNLVDFNGEPAIVTASTTTSITTSVPANAISGPINVYVGCDVASSTPDFIVDCGLAPTITSFSPANGLAGTIINITGTNFSTTPGDNYVDFNGELAIVTASTATSITTTVPSAATTGPITIVVACNNVTSSTNFVVGANITITTQPSDFIACVGQTASFTVAATGAANITYQWQYSSDGIAPFIDIANGGGYSNASTSTLSVNTIGNFGAGRYRCRINGDFASEVVTNDEGLFINPIPIAPTVTAASRCGNGSVILTASGGSNGQYRWYTASTGGTPIAAETSNTYTTPTLSATTTYYVSIDNGTCESLRTPIMVSINNIPNNPSITNASRCGTGAITLTAAGGAAGEYRWYSTATGGTAIAGETNNSYSIASLATTTTYYVAINNGNCESNRVAVVATINAIPTKPLVTVSGPTAICNGQSVVLTAPAGFTYAWSNGATTRQITASAAGTFTVTLNNRTCSSVASDPVIITITNCNQPPAITSGSGTTTIAGNVSISLSQLLSDPDNNLDLTTLKIITPPKSGATATIVGQTLIINYSGIAFAGTDELTIEVCDTNGACAQQKITIEVIGDIIPFNGISNNGDDKNSLFLIQYIDVLPETRQNKVSIFNRWGDLVWEGVNYDNQNIVFTGKNKNGSDLPAGTYFYKIEFFSNRSGQSGYLSLKR